jgi:hypothetical protein
MKKLLFTLAILFAAAIGLSAQNFRTGYFLDGYMYKYQLNPAFQGERGFLALPVIGGTSAGIESQILGTTLMYPSADGTSAITWFTDSEVSMDEFMSKIDKFNPANETIDINLLAIGFRAKNTYHTLDFSVRGQANEYIPSDAFRLAKDLAAGTEKNNIYDLSNWSANVNTFLQAAYGFSVKIKDIASIGFRAKVLLGAESVYSDLSNLHLDMGEDTYTINATGKIVASPYFNDMIVNNAVSSPTEIIEPIMSTPSIGAALDFGFSVDFLKHFTFSGSVLDLGFISWKGSTLYDFNSSNWELPYTKIEGEDGGLNSSIGQITAAAGEVAKSQDKYFQKLGFTTLLGLEFRVPFYTRISFGVLGTHRYEGVHSWTEGRFSVNYAPFRWFSVSGNYAMSTFGESYGAAVNLHPKGFNLFLGVDSFKPLLNTTAEYIPSDELNTNVKLGITFPFGKYNGRYPKKEKIGQE